MTFTQNFIKLIKKFWINLLIVKILKFLNLCAKTYFKLKKHKLFLKTTNIWLIFGNKIYVILKTFYWSEKINVNCMC